MAKLQEEFDICKKCGSDACYKITDGKHISWQCMDCGFYTNTMMLINSETVEYLIKNSPYLFNDIKFEDNDGLVWWPKVVNTPGVGIIFPDGSSADNWQWCFAPEVPIEESEKDNYPIKGPAGNILGYRTHKIDYDKSKHYARTDYILALNDAKLLGVS